MQKMDLHLLLTDKLQNPLKLNPTNIEVSIWSPHNWTKTVNQKQVITKSFIIIILLEVSSGLIRVLIF